MDLSQVWNWLPTFRVVAETEHLPTAAARLHVSTSALSRTIRLLEDRLGVELFNRSGRNIVLNTAGHRLLTSVQQAMVNVEVGCEAITADPLTGPLRVSALGLLTDHFVLPALLDLKAENPALIPGLESHRTGQANDRLSQGRLDVAFYYEGLTHSDLIIEKIGSTTSSVYCGVGHPLFEREDATFESTLDFEYSVPALGDSGVIMDGWPVDVDRKIGMHIWLLTSNLSVCLSGRLITVLPDVTAMPHLKAGRLRRFEAPRLPTIEMYAARHRSSAQRGSALTLIDQVTDEIDHNNEALEALFEAL